MCGITGILYSDKEKTAGVELISRMVGVLIHRGPDDEGIFVDRNVALGFRRLSIIDLSGAGHQPMCNEDETVWGVFNGEIYNFMDLRIILEKKGHRFKSRCDSEVLIHAYEEYGTECVKQFNGMFAFAVWDKLKQQLFCGRDRTGEKPFFYYHDSGKFLFASELKAILQDGTIKRDIDPDALNAYFSYMYVPESRCIFRSIRKLLPAHILIYRNGEIAISKYWDVSYNDYPVESEDVYAEKLRYLLTDAVKIRMYSDVPLGVFLSGGIDSSSITAIAARVSNIPVQTFSVSGGGGVFNELAFARVVAKAMRTKHSEFYATAENLDSLLPRLIGFIDEPFADSSIIPTYYVSKMSREKVSVALSGEGGDEVFGGGYPWYKRNAVINRLRNNFLLRKTLNLSAKITSMIPSRVKGSSRSLSRNFRRIESLSMLCSLRADESYEMIMRFFPDILKREVIAGSIIACEKSFAVGSAYGGNNARDPLGRALYADLKTYLPGDLLTKVDRMSMANSLEVRAPFLDYRVIEFAAQIPSCFKIKNGLTKYILRKSMTGLVPEVILKRRDKRGFSVPVGAWFRSEAGIFAKDILLDPQTLRRGIFLKHGIEDMLKEHQRGECDYGHQIWTLLVFELWARQYMQHS